jgi:hypothetical protein
LAYKRRRQSPYRGGTEEDNEHTYTLIAFTTILALASIKNLMDLEALPPLPPRL